jgi:antitoxin component YwqK of YwqJK toxin-antitoxin module
VRLKEQVSASGLDLTAEEFAEDGKPISEKMFRKSKPQGTWKFYAADGKNLTLKEIYDKGELNGIRTIYYPSGQRQVEETRLHGLVTGMVTNYYESGKVLSESLYHGSRQHGLYKSFHENGQVKEQGQYVANKRHKEWVEFDETGKLIKTYVFNAGILVEEKSGTGIKK